MNDARQLLQVRCCGCGDMINVEPPPFDFLLPYRCSLTSVRCRNCDYTMNKQEIEDEDLDRIS